MIPLLYGRPGKRGFLDWRVNLKFVHLSDLHLGKRVNEFSMIEDQKYILAEILDIIAKEQVDGVVIAGDIYDKTVPSEEAVQLLDWFLTKLAKLEVDTYVISGNHDSSVKLSFASDLIDRSGIHIAPVYNGVVKPYELMDSYGKVNLYLLPFIKPANVRSIFPEEGISNYTDACIVAINHMNINPEERNILVAHQYVMGAIKGESEEVSIGGLDQVDASVFELFDYVALGHLHGPQNVGKPTIRYCGTPLKYSFSEEKQVKSVTIIQLGKKGDVDLREVELTPVRDLRTIRGTFEELTAKEYYETTNRNDYLHIVLTDEEDILDAVNRLRVIYPYLMKLSYDNCRTRQNNELDVTEEIHRKGPMELFEEFYELQNNQTMNDEQQKLLTGLVAEIWEGK